MAGLFVLIFFAALAGVFKPYVKGLKRSHFGAAAAVAFVLFGITSPPPTQQPRGPRENSSPGKTESTNQASSAEPKARTVDAPAEPVSEWRYSESEDQMRDTTSRSASIQSENRVDLEFPYGSVKGTIWIRQNPQDGLDVAFQVDEGQVLCSAFTNTSVSIRFDDGPVQRFRCVDSSDGSMETAFITDSRRALAGLRRARRTILEAEFFRQGRKQFVFNTAGLQWQ